jgi:hypothetical protein
VNQYGFSLSKDQVFQKCKQVLKAKTKHLKSQGKGNNPNDAAALTSDDKEKFYAAVETILEYFKILCGIFAPIVLV